jgi:hypothetical protein
MSVEGPLAWFSNVDFFLIIKSKQSLTQSGFGLANGLSTWINNSVVGKLATRQIHHFYNFVSFRYAKASPSFSFEEVLVDVDCCKACLN